MPRILIVEDDPALARGLIALLSSQGHAADQVGEGESAIDLAATEPYSAIILDIGLPDITGHEVIRRLRARGVQTPVLMLTARDALEDRIRGLDGGSDDYLLKPFDPPELLARIRALIRRGSGDAQPRIQVGLLVCDPATCTATVSGRPLDLRRREWAVLHTLASRAGSVVPKERLGAEVFSFDDPVGTNAVEVYVARLRKKLQPDGPAIRTLRGLGYMMDGL